MKFEINLIVSLVVLTVISVDAVANAATTTAEEEFFDDDNTIYAEEARWLVNTGSWGTLSYIDEKGEFVTSDDDELRSAAVSYADSNGRVFFYLMGEKFSKGGGVTLTMSEAALEPTSNFAKAACGPKANVDPEDPRCAKLSLEGSLSPCADDISCQIGKKVLFDRHPEMKQWPPEHHFVVHEMKIQDVWMISNYGGGAMITLDDYFSVQPKHHPNYNIKRLSSLLPSLSSLTSTHMIHNNEIKDVPDWNKKVERARWIVGHSLWTTVSTISVRLNGSAWGNIRSIVDGQSYDDCTGKPVFYFPTPDPTNIDVQNDSTISLLFSEASIAERLGPSSSSCNGLDPMDPLCAQLMIVGKAVKIITDDDDDDKKRQVLKPIMKAFEIRHPLAPWLSQGGAHTGGAYYTIEPTHITLLDYYGGPTEVSVQDYLDWKKVPSTKTATEQQLLRGSASSTV